MKKLTPQIAALYLNAQAHVMKKDDNVNGWHRGRICEVSSRSNHGDWIRVWFDDVVTVYQWNSGRGELSSNSHTYFIGEDGIKLILRKLEDMTEEERKERDATKKYVKATPVHVILVGHETPETYLWYLSKSFDLFNGIEEGWAIDAKTLK